MQKKRPSHQNPCFRLVGSVAGEARVFDLKAGENIVGSRTEADVCLPEAVISRHHALIRIKGQDADLEDLGSTNGIFVNGVRIKTSAVREGDSLSFGSVPLTLVVVPDDETRLAFRVSPKTDVKGRDDSTELAQPILGNHSLIQTAREVSGMLLGPAEPDIGDALSALAAGIGAESACYLRADETGKPTVAGLWGSAKHFVNLKDSRVFQECSKGLSDGVFSTSTDGDPPQITAVRTQGNKWAEAIVVTGAPSGHPMESLLELVLLSLSSTGSPKVGIKIAQVRRVPELILPDDHIPGNTPASVLMYGELKRALEDSAPVLITGETGAGKEHAVRILHVSSPRATGPLKAVNCAAIPADLLEAELFGIEPGVATGVAGRKGKLTLAHTGMFLFDEVGDMPPALQAKLLRAIEQHEIHPIGARDPIPVDVRIVASTNVDLETRVSDGRFRADLFHRLTAHRIHVPPLRDRREDIPELVRSILTQLTSESGKAIGGVSIRAIQRLQDASWPGNIRQLENELRRAAAACPDGANIESAMLSPEILASADETLNPKPLGPNDLDLNHQVELLEHRLITQAIALTEGNLAAAARKLGITRNGLVMKMQRLGIDRG